MEVRRVSGGFTLGNSGLDLPQFAVAVHNVIDGGAAAAWAFLRNVGDFIPGVQDEFAVVGFQLSKEHRKQ